MIFSTSLPPATTFFAPLAFPAASTPTLLRFRAACFQGLTAAASAADAVRSDPRHRAQRVRFRARRGWSDHWHTRAIRAEQLLRCGYAAVGTGVFILEPTDHTPFGQHAQNTFRRGHQKARARQSARRQQETPRHAGHCFVFGLLVAPVTGTRRPCARRYYTRASCRPRAAAATARRPAPTVRTPTDRGADRIRDRRGPHGGPVLVRGDPAFEAAPVRAAGRARGFDWITPANPARRLAGSRDRKPRRGRCTQLSTTSATSLSPRPGLTDWWRHPRGSRRKAWPGQYARRSWARAETRAVHHVGTVGGVFATTQAPHAGRPAAVPTILLTNRDDGEAARVGAAEAVRWPVEQLFQAMKSDLGLSRYRVRSFVAVAGWVPVCGIAVVYLAWYRRRCRGEAERKEGWRRQRTHGLALPVQREREGADVERVATALARAAGQGRRRAGLRRAVPLEQRRPA
jgi:hypothetical protein